MTSAFIDAGGRASGLVDELLRQGWTDLSALDISEQALSSVRSRLGASSDRVTWHVADVIEWASPRCYDVWHDRAVPHFLTDPERRRAFRNTLVEGTDPGSHVIIATLAPGGSEKCSGLPIREYDARITMRELGSNSDLVSESRGRQRIAIYRPISAK